MEKYGFVYIWFDKKHKRYYIGAHWGTEDDGYICSSRWMMQAYRKRSKDFKRRILERIYTSKKETFITEGKWLKFIKLNELGKKYYNLQTKVSKYWYKGIDIDDPNRAIKIKETKLKKYGNENYNNREKAKKTYLQKYGVDCPLRIHACSGFHSEEHKEKFLKAAKTANKGNFKLIEKRKGGISWHKKANQWQIRMHINGKRFNFGYAKTFNEAIEIRDRKLKEWE